MPSTIRLHRVLKTTPDRLYRAFLDPDALVKWMPPNGFTAKVHRMDARVGGTYRMAEACYLGWQESLALLTLLVEPEIPEGA